MKNRSVLFLVTFGILVLLLSIRGNLGNPSEDVLNNSNWKEDGPFELSPDRGRFALTYSIVEDKSFFYSLPIARFATPDLGFKNGKYVSLFAPGISFLVVPGYIIGKLFGISQVGAFSVISLFAVFNLILVRAISIKLGANSTAATIASILFLFATPSFSYAVTLYQHHISTFLILASIYILMRWNSFKSLFIIWFLLAASISIDYPNLILMFPIGIFAAGKFFILKNLKDSIHVSVKLIKVATLIGIILPLTFFLLFNYKSYANPLQFSGTVSSIGAIDDKGEPAVPRTASPEQVDKFLNPEKQQKSALKFFATRNLLNGLYLHIFSPDRGIVSFTPVILFGIVGAVILYGLKNKYLPLIASIISLNILLYSMWGDPWGGWAFGSRYLIPAYSLMAIFASITLTKFRKNYLFIIVFFLIMMYSVFVNTLGALTTNANPPQVEVLQLEKVSGHPESYTFLRNADYLIRGNSKSFVFRAFAKKYLKATEYFLIISSLILVVSSGLIVKLYLGKK